MSGRPKGVVPKIPKRVMLSEELVAQINLELYSGLEGRVPNQFSQYVETILREHFKARGVML
jgi:hypothetical protein